MTDPHDLGQRLLFVGGLHRSGTSLLAQLIAEHPDGSGLTDTGANEDEGQHLQDVYPAAQAYGGPGRFARNRAAHLTETSALVSADSAQRLLASWSPHWDLSKQVLVEKSPPNLIMGRFLQALFPDAKFLFIVRHPVSVTLATRKWRARMPLARLMNHWFLAHATARDDLPQLANVHVVSYEWLMADPDPTLAGVAEFLGLTSPLGRGEINPTRNSRYSAMWQQLLDEGDRGARACRDRLDSTAREYGYDLADPTTAPQKPLTLPA